MLVLQLIVLFVLVLGTAFITGKKLGQRRHNKVLEQMKLLENKYDHMLDEMSNTSLTCSEIIEKKTSKLVELLEIIDKKCLYADDLIANLDESCNDIKLKERVSDKSRDRSEDANTNEHNNNLQFREELKEALSTMFSRLVELENDINEVKKRLTKFETQKSDEFTQKNKILTLEQELKKLIDSVETIGKTVDRSCSLNTLPNDMLSIRKDDKLQEPITPAEQKDILDSRAKSVMKNFKKTIPKQNLTIHEVLKQVEDGITIPQIARSMGIGKGEIDLIINIYGNSKSKGDSEKCL